MKLALIYLHNPELSAEVEKICLLYPIVFTIDFDPCGIYLYK